MPPQASIYSHYCCWLESTRDLQKAFKKKRRKNKKILTSSQRGRLVRIILNIKQNEKVSRDYQFIFETKECVRIT